MTNTQKWLLGIALAALALIIIFWKQIKAFFTAPATIPKTDFEKCVEANKSKPDGEACSNCVETGSGMPSYNGVIKDGKCLPKQETAPPLNIGVQLKVTTATRFANKNANGTFSVIPDAQLLPIGTIINVAQLITAQDATSNTTYYQTNYGYVNKADVQVIMLRTR